MHHLSFALGDCPAASFAQRLMLQVSNDTLLRVVSRRAKPSVVPPTVVGINDWAEPVETPAVRRAVGVATEGAAQLSVRHNHLRSGTAFADRVAPPIGNLATTHT